MKATISAICILALVICACFASTFYTKAVCDDIITSLNNAQELIRNGSPTEAEQVFSTASEKWEKKSNLFRMFIEHIELSYVDNAFSRAKAALKTGNMAFASVEISLTVDLLAKLSENDAASFPNIF